MIDMNQFLYFPDSYQNRGENEKDIICGNILFKDFENTKALLCQSVQMDRKHAVFTQSQEPTCVVPFQGLWGLLIVLLVSVFCCKIQKSASKGVTES